MGEIVSFDDLRELSGFRNLSRVKRWLTDSGVPFLVDRHGRPKVNLYALRRAMGGEHPGADNVAQGNQEPKWDDLN